MQRDYSTARRAEKDYARAVNHMIAVLAGLDNLSLGPIADHLGRHWTGGTSFDSWEALGDFDSSVTKLMRAMGVEPAHELLLAHRDLMHAARISNKQAAACDVILHAFVCRTEGRSPW